MQYALQVVVANVLGEHRFSVTIVTQGGDGPQAAKLELSPNELDRGAELEERIVLELVKKHNLFIGTGKI